MSLKVGDILIFSRGKDLMTLEVLELGFNRGKSSDAKNLYKEFLI